MSKIMNLRMKGKRLVTAFGLIQFDSDGVVDLPEEQAEEFLKMKGFEPAEEIKNPEQETTNESPVVNSSTEEENKQKNDEDKQEDENQDEPAEETPDFDKMTVPQLKKYAKEHDIDLMGANKKDEIIPLIIGSEN